MSENALSILDTVEIQQIGGISTVSSIDNGYHQKVSGGCQSDIGIRP